MAGTGTLTVTPDTGSSTVTINTLPPSGPATPPNSLPMTLDTTVEGTLGTSTAAAITVQGGTGMVPVVVGGSVAPGSAPIANPVGVSGVDSGGLKRAILTDTTGATVSGAGENHVGEVGGNSARVYASFARPANTTAYALGQLVANSTTAGSVVPLTFTAARKAGGTGVVTRIQLSKTGSSLTNAAFRVHLYTNSPTPSNGDGGTWLTTSSLYLGYADVTMDKAFTDVVNGTGVPKDSSGNPCTILFAAAAGTQTIFGLIEARAAYTPASGETFTATLETSRD